VAGPQLLLLLPHLTPQIAAEVVAVVAVVPPTGVQGIQKVSRLALPLVLHLDSHQQPPRTPQEQALMIYLLDSCKAPLRQV
jgi:hypothetical protein